MPEPEDNLDLVWVEHPRLGIRRVPKDRLDIAVRKDGVRVASQEQVAEHLRLKELREQETETLGGKVQSFIEGGVNAAGLGLPSALAAQNLSPEELEKARIRSESGAYTAGTVAGTVAPYLAGPGGLLAKTPAGVLARGSNALGQAVERTVAGGGAGALRRVVARAAGEGAQGLTEGAIITAGQAWSESALGGEEMTAEKLYASMREGAALGGLGGAGFGLGAGLLSAGGKAVGKGLSRAAEGVAEADAGPLVKGYTKLSSPLSGADPEDIMRGVGDAGVRADWHNQAKIIENSSRDLASKADGVMGMKGVTRSALGGELKAERVARTVKRGEDTMTAARTKAENIRNATDELLPDPKQVRRAAKQAEREVDTAVTRGASKTEVAELQAKAIRAQQRVEDIDFLETKFGKKNLATMRARSHEIVKRVDDAIATGDEAQVYAALDNAKRDLDQVVKDGKRSLIGDGPVANKQQNRATVDFAKAQADDIRSFLESDEVWGAAGVSQRALNKAASEVLSTAADFERATTKQFQEAVTGSYGTQRVRVADPTKMRSLIKRIADDGTTYEAQQVMRHLDSEERMAKALIEHGGLEGKALQQAKKSLDDVQSFRNTLKDATKRLENAAVINRLNKAEREGDLFGGGGPLGGVLLGGLTAGPLGALATGAFSALRKPGTVATNLAKFESIAGRVSNFDKTAKSKLRQFSSAVSKRDMGDKARRVARAAPAAFVAYQSSDKRKAEVDRRTKRLQEFLGNPDRIVTASSEITRGMQDATPKTAMALAQKQLQVMQYLWEQLPKPPESAMHPKQRERWVPTEGEMREYARKERAAVQPLSILDDLANGELHLEAVKTVKELHPLAFSEMQRFAMEMVAESPEPLPYDANNQLSLMFEFAGDPTLSPDFGLRQGARWAEYDNMPPPPPPSRQQAPDLSSGTQLMTDKIASTL